MRWLGKETVNVIPKRQLQPERDAAGTAADPARQIDKQRMFRIHDPLLRCELRFQTLARHRIA
ncbi:hypothetical protein D3C86_2203530 [compost metagenome]